MRRLRPIVQADLPRLHALEMNPRLRHVAAAQRPLEDAATFAARLEKMLSDPRVTLEGIEVDGVLAGFAAKFERNGIAEIGYWLDEPFWGRGHATWALSELLAKVTTRPLVARAVKDNVRSLRVLEKCGFHRVREDRFFSSARGCDVDEWVYELGRRD